ncbi:MAG: hypothetical protein KGJ19_08300 [Betaproteobacteria bacterium]|nr:hypothetical protein [Betaproteobacteria bacterium]
MNAGFQGDVAALHAGFVAYRIIITAFLGFLDLGKLYRWLLVVQNIPRLFLQSAICLYVGKLLTKKSEVFRFFPFCTRSKMQLSKEAVGIISHAICCDT